MKLEIICAWCQKHLSFKECANFDESLPRISHSICDECRTKVLDDLKQTGNPKRQNKSQPTIERRS